MHPPHRRPLDLQDTHDDTEDLSNKTKNHDPEVQRLTLAAPHTGCPPALTRHTTRASSLQSDSGRRPSQHSMSQAHIGMHDVRHLRYNLLGKATGKLLPRSPIVLHPPNPRHRQFPTTPLGQKDPQHVPSSHQHSFDIFTHHSFTCPTLTISFTHQDLVLVPYALHPAQPKLSCPKQHRSRQRQPCLGPTDLQSPTPPVYSCYW
ncbi:hypothetical protein B0T25DRAFT_5523 [Lasiosphaeria hispida]|uniref:Uncharacterized protein n=1 Tax=Lasiosphaeria hispida TaxID=260671 RepID=A0AAJ0HT45_9PEZI|nr:hypothetical protein B0T25DRAFT_5523 [Lasiosphaeria hispida]